MAAAQAPSHAKKPVAGSQSMASFWTQMFPPKPTYTEEQMPDLTGKVSQMMTLGPISGKKKVE
jgi:retinol dehydrogenase-12